MLYVSDTNIPTSKWFCQAHHWNHICRLLTLNTLLKAVCLRQFKKHSIKADEFSQTRELDGLYRNPNANSVTRLSF